MNDFTPSTESVRNIYVEAGEDEGFNEDEANAEFTRWLSVHDAQVAAETLRAAGREHFRQCIESGRDDPASGKDWLDDQATAYRVEGEEKTT